MNQQKIAKFISVVFGIRVLPFILFIVVLSKSGLSPNQLLLITPITIFLLILVPIFYIFFAIRSKKASSWDLSKREERYGFIKTALISGFLALLFIYFYGNQLLFHLTLTTILILVIIGFITRYWKISFHASLITGTVILINFLFDWSLPILYLLIPLVFWARFTLKQHSLAQLFAGSLISGGITLAALKLFGYL